MRYKTRPARFSRNSLTVAILTALAGMAQALPQGGAVAAGSGSLNQSGNNLTVNQGTQKLIIDWQSFGIAGGESVQFVQPNSSSVALNRVLGNNSSEIFGSLAANGQVFLTNPNGILFGSTAQVDVGGLVASTLNISNADFLSGNYVFTGEEGGTITNQGTLNAKDGGVIALLAPEVRNEGLILAKAGAIGLGAGTRITLDLSNGLRLEVEESALNAVIENHHAVRAEGGVIILSASARQTLLSGMINNTGVIDASSVREDGGRIYLQADLIAQSGTVDASGKNGGMVQAGSRSLLHSGDILVRGHRGTGGRIALQADSIVQPDSALADAGGSTRGGSIQVQGRNSVFTSGTLTANGGLKGGSVDVLGDQLQLAAATVSTTGAQQGGQIHIGGGYQGQGSRQRATTTWINPFTTLDASATHNGNGGKVIVWSDGGTAFGGTALAKGGAQSGNGGLIEVSGKNTLQFAGLGDASAANGVDGTLLLDPKNIFITDAVSTSLQIIPLLDPSPTPGDFHGGGQTVELANGNIVQASTADDFGAEDAGAVYMYQQSDGALLSMLIGSSTDDSVGSGGITELANGNFVVNSFEWNNGAATDAGAVTWGSATSGVSGVVSASNSLVGSTTDDQVGSFAGGGVIALSNGNYVVRSIEWDNGAAVNAGAVTWGDGTTGVTGAVSASNSLVGSSTDDRVGNFGVVELGTGNYVVSTADWDNGAATDAGAVTWGSGTSGVSGVVSVSNSLVGSTTDDRVGNGGVTLLSNGNYVVSSTEWNNGAATDAGAVTWGSGSSGVSGVVSAGNSLVGSSSDDRVGFNAFTGGGDITALSNGNYVVTSTEWDNGAATNAGAVTWGDGSTGITGAVSAGNSLVGDKFFDRVGYSFDSVTELSNGNYVVSSTEWNNGAATDAGAATWGSGTSGVSGVLSASNSLVGSSTGDFVSSFGITTLNNGNYVVRSAFWNNGAIDNAGAATWGDGTTGVSGAVSASNSLVGTTMFDSVSGDGVTALSNGNYVVRSAEWDNGAAINAGAVTWGDGTTGITGAVTTGNSLVGSTTFDAVGSDFGGVFALSNGNYVVSSALWDNGAATDAGAVTWGNGSGGTTGPISAGNSLVGSTTDDSVGESQFSGGGGITLLTNGNYVVSSPEWDNGGIVNAGAVTWGSGTSGVTGVITSSNSLVGDTTGDLVGGSGFDYADSGVTALTNGNYVVASGAWSNGAIVDAGAVTWGDGSSGTTGVVSAGNSLVGTTTNDSVGGPNQFTGVSGIIALTNGNYVVNSGFWDNGAATDAGAVTWGNGSGGTTGAVSAGNSLVGSTSFDHVGGAAGFFGGNGDVIALSNGNYVVRSPDWNNGAAIDAGAVTLGDGSGGTTGVVSSFNSLVGTSSNDAIGIGSVFELSNGDPVITSPLFASNTGRVDILRFGPGGGFPLTGNLGFGDDPGADVTIAPSSITAITNTGTNLVLQANNDITVADPILTNNPSGNGGDLTLQAGRSVFVQADIVTDGGDLTVVANERFSNGVIPAFRNPGGAQLVVSPGVDINAGSGDVRLTVANENHAGEELLFIGDAASITARNIRALNRAPNGDISIGSGAVLTGTGNGLPLIVGTTNGGDVISLDGADAAQTPNGFWLAFELKSSRFNFAVGDSDGVIRSGSVNR